MDVYTCDEAFLTGTVHDPSGAVLPGVTVEAASPALIEKSRSATTDGSGPLVALSGNCGPLKSVVGGDADWTSPA